MSMRQWMSRGGAATLALTLAVAAVGCARQAPPTIEEVNRTLAQLKDTCATIYAADDLAEVEGQAQTMNDLAGQKKYKKAGREAEALLPRLQEIRQKTDAAREAARAEAEGAVQQAESALAGARDEGAPDLAGGRYQEANSKLDEARRLMQDPCKYAQAKAAAQEAATLAERAKVAAIAERKRREEEARRRAEEEARRRAEEEARRRAEEEARRYPKTYEVKRGDYLWKISGFEFIYNAPKYWPLIYDANRDKIRDPDLIYPGQKLNIPREMSEDEMMRKLRIMWSKAARGEPL